MLTRLKFRRDFRVIARCFSDKPSDDGGKATDQATKAPAASKKVSDATEKVQQLLKAMLAAQAQPIISEEEYQKKFTVAPERPRKQKAEDEIERKTEQIEENLTKVAGQVAQAIGGDVKQTEAELLSKVLGKINQTSTSLSDLIIGMKVDRSKEPDSRGMPERETRGQQVKRLVSRARENQPQARFTERKAGHADRVPINIRKSIPQQPTMVDIFSGEPLGIFKPESEKDYGTKLELWERLEQRELALATAQPPTNYFEKMIHWTDQGKVWKFPIDNEQGMEEEQIVHFSEHVFLDVHLEDWCPKKGPIRHFMELVCVGLSKNAFYTVKEKKDHIMWYKEYFESKKDILTEVGAWDIPTKSGSGSSKST